MSRPLKRNMVLVLAAVLPGCAAPHVQRPSWTRFGNYSTPDKEDAFYRNAHHQYFDTATGKYYYFDPVKRQYFWENGEPKT